MHLLDPHYLCVPSLHIAVVCLTYTFMRKVFEEENYSAEEKESWSRDLYAGAVNIAETVLYVKQHSVNCVSAALYMMASVFPSLFTQKDAVEFLDSMFKNAQDIPQDDIKLILDYMKSMFLQFMEQGQNSKDWSEPLKKWLIKCEKRADNS